MKREAFFVVERQEDTNSKPAAARRECCSCGMEYGGEHRWTARDRAVTARTVQYLDRRGSFVVDIDELEDCLLGPEE